MLRVALEHSFWLRSPSKYNKAQFKRYRMVTEESKSKFEKNLYQTLLAKSIKESQSSNGF